MRATSVGLFVVFGAVGFATGEALGGFSMLSPVPLPVSILLAGAVGGASLGAALGYLEKRRLAGEPRAA